MGSCNLDESNVKCAAIAWLEVLGYIVPQRLNIALGEPGARRDDESDHDMVLLGLRLQKAPVGLDSDRPPAALEDAWQELTSADLPPFVGHKRPKGGMLAERATVERQACGEAFLGANAPSECCLKVIPSRAFR